MLRHHTARDRRDARVLKNLRCGMNPEKAAKELAKTGGQLRLVGRVCDLAPGGFGSYLGTWRENLPNEVLRLPPRRGGLQLGLRPWRPVTSATAKSTLTSRIADSLPYPAAASRATSMQKKFHFFGNSPFSAASQKSLHSVQECMKSRTPAPRSYAVVGLPVVWEPLFV